MNPSSIHWTLTPPSQVFTLRNIPFAEKPINNSDFFSDSVRFRQERQEMAAVGTLLYLEDWATMNGWTSEIYDVQMMM